MQVKQVMRSQPRVLPENANLSDAAKIYLNCDVNCAPVIGEKGKVEGILTVGKVLESLLQGKDLQTPVREVMDTNLQTVGENENVEEIITDKPIERLLVYNDQQQLTGILTRLDLIKKVYDSLQETRNELSVVLESMHSAIIAVDTEQRITIYNSAAEKLVGIEAKKAIGHKITAILPNSPLPRILETETSESAKKCIINDKKLLVNHSPIRYKGKLIGAVGILQDVSELEEVHSELSAVKELYAQLEGIIQSSYDGIIVINNKGEIVRANNSSCKLLGINKKPEEIIGSKFQSFNTTSAKILDSIMKSIKSSSRTATYTFTNGEAKEIVVTGSGDFNEENKLERIIINIRDITELNELKNEIERTREEKSRYSAELKELRVKHLQINEVISRSSAMRDVLQLAVRVAEVDSTVLITGETGVGKEVVAKLIHNSSSRNDKSFIQVNCGAIPENLMESELFGYEPGAFTGAGRQGKIGLMEMANGGTLFLDEIGELPLNLQVKLLRSLQEKQIYKVGGTEPVVLDIRIVAATNRDLEQMIREGKFRRDLYYRLNVVHINIPPLRERKEDIAPLANHFLQKFNDKYKKNIKISSEVYDTFENYDWPGNVRELENAIERALILSQGEWVEVEHLPSYMKNSNSIEMEDCLKIHANKVIPLKDALAEVEKEIIRLALKKHKSIRKAAKALGVTHTTVNRKKREYGI